MRSLLGPLLNRAPVPFTDIRRPWYASGTWGRSNQQAHMNAMSASAALYSIVSRTSTATAKQEWHLHKPTSADTMCPECEMEGVQMVDQHPALVVLNKPNPFYTRQELFESGQQHVDLTGEGWTIISRIGSIPAELWVARPDRMVVVTDPRDFILGYIYVGPDGREMPLKLKDVLSIRMPNPMDPYRGMGPVQTIMAQIEGASMSAEWNANFFRNGARPGGIVKLSRRMPDKDFNQLVERFNLNHKGPANANRTAFLEEGDWIDPKPMTVADMQFTETANLNRDTILLAYGASKFDVGVLEDVNRASANAASNNFGERMTVPRLDRWAGMLNNDFLSQFPGTDGYEFVYCSPVQRDRTEDRSDKLTSAQVFQILINSRVDPVEAAEVAGLPPLTVAPEPVPVIAPPGTQPGAVPGDPGPNAEPMTEPAAA